MDSAFAIYPTVMEEDPNRPRKYIEQQKAADGEQWAQKD